MALSDFFKPRWRHSDPSIRKAAAAQLDDEAVAVRLAGSDPDDGVRAAAARRVEELAARRAANASGIDALRALEGVADPGLLRELAKDAVDPAARAAAVRRSGDEAVLDAALAGDDALLRAELVAAGLEESRLLERALRDECWAVRGMAAARLSAAGRRELLERTGGEHVAATGGLDGDAEPFVRAWTRRAYSEWQQARHGAEPSDAPEPATPSDHAKLCDEFDRGTRMLPRVATIAFNARLCRRLMPFLVEECGSAELRRALDLEAALRFVERTVSGAVERFDPMERSVDVHMERCKSAEQRFKNGGRQRLEWLAHAAFVTVESMRKATPALGGMLVLITGMQLNTPSQAPDGGPIEPAALDFERRVVGDLRRLLDLVGGSRSPEQLGVPPEAFGPL